MTTKQVLQQALEALECTKDYDHPHYEDQLNAIEALKASLAQQGEQQPVAWKHSCNALCVDELELFIDSCPHCGKPRSAGAAPAAQSDDKDLLTIAAMDAYQMGKRDALAQQGEPVAKYIGETPYGSHVQLYEDLKKGTELYAGAAPAAQQGEQQPVGFMSPKQLERIQDSEDEAGTYIPMRKTAAGNFTLALYAGSAPAAQQGEQRCDTARVLEWMRTPNRKAAQFAFTEGPERQAAYWIEIAQSEPAAQPDARKVIEQMVVALEIAECHLAYVEITEAREAGQKWLEENKWTM